MWGVVLEGRDLHSAESGTSILEGPTHSKVTGCRRRLSSEASLFCSVVVVHVSGIHYIVCAMYMYEWVAILDPRGLMYT